MNAANACPCLDYIRDNNGVVQTDHRRRFDHGYLEAKRLSDGRIGPDPLAALRHRRNSLQEPTTAIQPSAQ